MPWDTIAMSRSKSIARHVSMAVSGVLAICSVWSAVEIIMGVAGVTMQVIHVVTWTTVSAAIMAACFTLLSTSPRLRVWWRVLWRTSHANDFGLPENMHKRLWAGPVQTLHGTWLWVQQPSVHWYIVS